ncbi:hypothetical protein [Halorhabdus amylolytica]|uniref:hypothetical protein n=1 Tax=Halorhabdus amylolytica TaxID=2559573 RepID=UPI0010AABB87|nr:hypothetical protein [Halorhabdus amylolytica]
MQRRAAAVYIALFLVVGAGAYGFMGLTEEPSVSLAGETYTAGDTLTVQDRTYTVGSVDDGSGELTWRDPSAEFSATLENGTTVSPLTLTWDGQVARWSTTLADGTEISTADGTVQIGVNASADPPTAALEPVENDSETETIAVGDTLEFRGNETTVTAVDAEGVTLTWGESYLVSVPNASDPDSVTFRQQLDVSTRLANDPAVYNETVTVDGVESVVWRSNDSTIPLETYLPEPDTASFSEGDSLTYEGSTVTVGNITAGTVPLSWTDERTNTITFSEGANITLAGQSYFAHFPDDSSVQILPHGEAYESYQQQLEEIDYYGERMLGLWGVTILSLIAAILLLGLAYLPVKG